MGNTIRIRRRASGGAAGAPSSLANAELAYNEQDDTLYYGKGTGGAGGSATTIPAIAGPGAFTTLNTTQTISGDKTFSGAVAFSGTLAFPSVGQRYALVGPTGGAGAPTFRALVGADVSDLASVVQAYALSAFAVPSADVAWNSKKITGLADPTSAQDAATKAYVDARAAGLDPKASVRAMAIVNIDVSAGGVANIDGVTSGNGDRIALVGQTTASENGIWICNTGGAWARAADWATGLVTTGAYFFVEEGSWGGTGWVLNTPGAITVGTTSLSFVQFSGAGEINVDGSILTKSGNTIAVGNIPVNNGGTGATTAANARTNLGLGTMATQAASAVAITGGSIQNLTTFDSNTIDGGTY